MVCIDVTDFSANGNGSADNTNPFQKALDALEAAGGGTLYVPAGNYELGTGDAGSLTWTSTKTLRIVGDGPGASNLRLNCTTTPYACLSVKNADRFICEDLSFLTDQDPKTYDREYICVALTDNSWSSFHRVVMQEGKARRVNQGIVVSGGGNTDIDGCDIRSYVNCCRFFGGCANVTIRASQLYMNSGSGVGSASCVLCDASDGGMGTIRIIGTTTNSGDRGVYWLGGTGASPAFGFFYDVEVNNPTVCGMQFDTGAEIWMTSCWVANTHHLDYVMNGVQFGSSFQGLVRMTDCTVGGFSGHDVNIESGMGYALNGVAIGSSQKYAANTYDAIHIGAACSNVTVCGSHINADAYSSLSENHPRAAVYVEPGAANVNVVGCIAADGGYGTAPLVGSAVTAGNINI
jgi:hypothetical protein